jgi:hypothetical protein
MPDVNNFQRRGVVSNAHAGREFEQAAQVFFRDTGIVLQPSFSVPIGCRVKKEHKFDLGSSEPPILVECKSYTWTETGNSPSAKIHALNEVMLLFSVSPPEFRKILFILRHMRGDVSLGAHYIKSQGHLIGDGIEIWEFDMDTKKAERIFPQPN